MRLLIVDDSKAMRSIVMRALRQAGYEGHTFEEASNGAEALELIRRSPPDLVLSDWNMPEMNGPALLEAIRQEGLQVRFGFITSESTAEIREQALAGGASFLLTKPFTPDSLRSALAGAF
ncbi:MAG TPA: response regulator [Vulgatibacter sp.]|nr:response regulator [Vulgatibacter sp.]